LPIPGGSEIQFIRNGRARRYILRVNHHGIRVTIPRNGSQEFARRFVVEKQDWIQAQFERMASEPPVPTVWKAGTGVWYRGELLPLRGEDGHGRLADREFPVPADASDWRPFVEAHLRELATAEIPHLVLAAAARQKVIVRRVIVRNQRTRWGSCSRRGTISLNWRLVQTPFLVRDYLIAHELAHLREMNHSNRFWRVVHEMFPTWREAESWLRKFGRNLLR
jgi:predicted metal-dependent hydrolase